MSAPTPRDAANWAASGLLHTANAPSGAIDRNVTGRRVTSPIQGFGKLWHKTYRVRLCGCDITPAELITLWKAEYAAFWPKGSRFYGAGTGIHPGDTALLNIGFGHATLVSTGILVLYADDESFTFMTPEGHSFAGWITFSAERDGDDTVAKIEALIRASDPLYEVAMAFGMQRMEDRQWQATLTALATRVGCTSAQVEMRRVCVDRRRQWTNARNVWQNSAVRTFTYLVMHPRRRLAG